MGRDGVWVVTFVLRLSKSEWQARNTRDGIKEMKEFKTSLVLPVMILLLPLIDSFDELL